MRLHAHEWGDRGAAPVVCLHGVGGHGGRFRRLAERLAARHRIVSLDLRGHGRSGWEPPWSLETHVEDVLETLNALGVEQTVLVGHSFGGRVGMTLVAQAQDPFTDVVLLDPAIWVPPPIALARAEEWRADLSYAHPREAVEARLASPTVLQAPPELIEEEVAEHLQLYDDGRWRFRFCASAVVAAFGEMARVPPSPERLRARTLIVRGASSEVVPDDLVAWYRGGLGDLLEVVDVPGGHSPLWDAFDATADAVTRFLGTAPTSGA